MEKRNTYSIKVILFVFYHIKQVTDYLLAKFFAEKFTVYIRDEKRIKILKL